MPKLLHKGCIIQVKNGRTRRQVIEIRDDSVYVRAIDKPNVKDHEIPLVIVEKFYEVTV